MKRVSLSILASDQSPALTSDAQTRRPERWCHRIPPVRLGSAARPIASSYSGNTQMLIVLTPKTVFAGSSGATDPSPYPDPGPKGILVAGLENIGSLHTQAGFLIL